MNRIGLSAEQRFSGVEWGSSRLNGSPIHSPYDAAQNVLVQNRIGVVLFLVSQDRVEVSSVAHLQSPSQWERRPDQFERMLRGAIGIDQLSWIGDQQGM